MSIDLAELSLEILNETVALQAPDRAHFLLVAGIMNFLCTKKYNKTSRVWRKRSSGHFAKIFVCLPPYVLMAFI